MTEAYLWGLSNSSGVPLVYVVRTDDNPPVTQEEFPSLKAKLVACTEHDGEGFAADNEQVWSIMQEAIMNGPPPAPSLSYWWRIFIVLAVGVMAMCLVLRK